MAIIGAGPTLRQVQRGRGASLDQTEATTWLLGITADPAAVRRAVLAELGSGSTWSKVRSLGDGRHRAVDLAEVPLWVDEVVRTGPAVEGDLARAHALGSEPLERRPFVVVVAPDAVVLRWHRGLAGHREARLLLQRLASPSRHRRAA
ncbi:hypothetical protein [Nocardioides marmoraquaticus]